MSNDTKYVKILKSDNPFEEGFKIKLSGGRWTFVAIALFALCFNTCGIENQLRKSNELKKEQLKQAYRQYTLDSLRFEHMRQQPQK